MTKTTTDATLTYVNGEPTLRFERRLRHAPAKVWRAVTDPAELKHWFPAAVEAELRPGAPMRFTFPDTAPVDGQWDGEVLEVDEPKVFMFRWNSDVLRIELVPDGDGCLLVFSQTLGGGRVGLLGAGRAAAGWDTCLDQLVARLDGTTVPHRTDWVTPMAHYIEQFGLGEGTVVSTPEGDELRFARDLVWRAPADTWPVLVDSLEVDATKQEPPRVLEHGWSHDGEPAGTVRWEFVSDPRLGERVELTHVLPAARADLRALALATWHHRLELFFAAATGGVHDPWSEDRVAELVEHYG
ncbi:SRPBCC family protein [Actinophytocola sp.]|uniref:SRPBCC family protein n=1 Tax=Actinophytocola sp. TaxID=1872138 RepID=UPI00389A469F